MTDPIYHVKAWNAIPLGVQKQWPGACGPGCVAKLLPSGPLLAACKFHDFAYMVGGTRRDFFAVEKEFRRRLVTGVSATVSHMYSFYFWALLCLFYSAMTLVWGLVLRRWELRDEPLSLQDIVSTQEYDDAKERYHANR